MSAPGLSSESPLGVGRPRHGAGPTVLVVLGSLALVGALLAGLVGARGLAEVAPVGVLSLSGGPGPKVVAVLDTPGTTEVELEAEEDYSFFLVGSTPLEPRLEGDIVVHSPDGWPWGAEPTRLASEATVGARTARAVADLVPRSTGVHVIEVPRASSGDAELWLADVSVPDSPVAAIFTGVGGILLAVVLGLIGTGLIVGGIVWRALRRPADSPRAKLAPPLY